MDEIRYGPVRLVTSGSAERVQAHVPRALKLLRQVQERARLGGLKVLQSQWALDDDSYCYAIVAGGMATVHVVAGYPGTDEPEAVTPVAVPDFVSGAVRNGHIVDVAATSGAPASKTLATFHPTQACAEAFDLAHGYQNLPRLAVEPFVAFSELRNQSQSGKPEFSQYTRLKPTMYSGTMRKVVQAVMGFGRQRREGKREVSLYDAYRASASEAVAVPGKYAKDVAKDGLQVRYDWRFSRTHGVTRASDGRWWLVEISITQGVIAMPLPLHEATTTARFRDWIEARRLPRDRQHEHANDAEVLTMLDEFGGFPTGEAFPVGSDMDAWVRAGRVVRLAAKEEVAEFYGHSPYSSAMGWAFNARGDETHNTAWTIGDDGFMRGVHYAVTLQIGTTNKVKQADGVDALLARLERLRGKDMPGFEAVMWKCRRVSAATVDLALRAPTDEAAFSRVDLATATPLATGAAAVRRLGAGYLYNPAKVGNLIKFPEPEIGLLVSVDMRVADSPTQIGPRCDTTIHVFFDGDEFNWVRYCRDPRPAAERQEDSTEECMFVGSWATVNWWGGPSIPAALYSNDFDDRTEPEGMDSTTTVGRDLGYSMTAVSDDPTRPYLGEAFRVRRFLRRTTSVAMPGERVETGVCVPFGDREAYYYAVWRHRAELRSEIHSFAGLRDPWTCMTWRNYPGYTGRWAGDILTGHWVQLAMHPDNCGRVTARTVMSPSPEYKPYQCSDYADKGPWCFVCDDMDRAVFTVPEPPVPPPKTEMVEVRDGAVWLRSTADFGPIKTKVLSDGMGEWSLHSPLSDPTTSSDQYIEETHNVIGDASAMRFDKDINSGSAFLGAARWADVKGPLTFIGVLNG